MPDTHLPGALCWQVKTPGEAQDRRACSAHPGRYSASADTNSRRTSACACPSTMRERVVVLVLHRNLPLGQKVRRAFKRKVGELRSAEHRRQAPGWPESPAQTAPRVEPARTAAAAHRRSRAPSQSGIRSPCSGSRCASSPAPRCAPSESGCPTPRSRCRPQGRQDSQEYRDCGWSSCSARRPYPSTKASSQPGAS